MIGHIEQDGIENRTVHRVTELNRPEIWQLGTSRETWKLLYESPRSNDQLDVIFEFLPYVCCQKVQQGADYNQIMFILHLSTLT